MKHLLYLLFITILFTGCLNNKKTNNDNTQPFPIHKLWKYDTVRYISKNPGLIGRHILDLTNKDTLRFSYQPVKNNSTSYAYNISHDTIFVNKKAAYKVVNLNARELELYILFKDDSAKASKDSIIMIYKTY